MPRLVITLENSGDPLLARSITVNLTERWTGHIITNVIRGQLGRFHNKLEETRLVCTACGGHEWAEVGLGTGIDAEQGRG